MQHLAPFSEPSPRPPEQHTAVSGAFSRPPSAPLAAHTGAAQGCAGRCSTRG